MGRTRTNATKQAKMRRDQRREKVAELYRQGLTIKEIAAGVKVHRNTIWEDLQVLHAQWLQRAETNYAAAKVRELQKLAWLESEATAAWERSQLPAVTETEETLIGSKDGNSIKNRTTRKHQAGDLKCLSEIRACVESRCRLLGLYPREQADAAEASQAGPAELKTILAEMTDEELKAMSAPFRKYRELVTRRFRNLN